MFSFSPNFSPGVLNSHESTAKTPFNREERKEREGNSKMF